ncbi:TolC family protein [Anaeromyxobacter paludicola]|uniref:Transporter n=1 Tax=Anaeromyxobacter paludicola TaxID=2918171 RepID=A0ABN6NDQ8_9BACT|nr:TolC family protein [Anaeromyxobacter paludicola]BDG10177.1 transporter [Anaeromyxobacter paludicola]
MTGLTLALALAAAQPQPLPPPSAPAAQPQPLTTSAPAAGPVLPLDEALRQAQARNLDLKAAQARLEQSNQLSAKAWSGYLPQLSAAATYTHNNVEAAIQLPTGYYVRDAAGGAVPPGTTTTQPPAYDPASPASPTNPPGGPTTLLLYPSGYETAVVQKQDQLNAQLQLTQALFAPAVWYAVKTARTGEELSASTVEAARRDILFGAAQLYYGAASLKQAVAVQERILATNRDHERDARARYEAGTVPKITLLRAEIDRARSEQDLKRAQSSYAQARISLATLLDRKDTAFEVELPPEPATAAGDLEARALSERPDVRAARQTVTLDAQQRDALYTGYLPALGAFGHYRWSNASGFTGLDTSWDLGLSLSWNLFDGGLREANLREARARLAEAEATRASTEAKAVDEVQRARLDLDSAVANRAKADEQLALARENHRLVEVNFRAGAATYVEVSDAVSALVSAELGRVNEGLNADLAALRLQKAAGLFNPVK